MPSSGISTPKDGPAPLDATSGTPDRGPERVTNTPVHGFFLDVSLSSSMG
ncbi:hypothetical protein PACID_27340 [Acidipropionibacterium acidipropionici ATCC 4875]|uniref:Uncharacterized protein n=1 Tax=Acidipropionibacterium acidipropionici (strain ATCC 4875 / DSM 20272 / JCM 6432 / NBRC 12425 / NCIMB 8070 / 4) TaxID=1171373 RepID=K7RVS1_ACIA4|nr:hypothetical protein PACID_27340 [Acidipropionibacterium acidipropionici ATCC 4875]